MIEPDSMNVTINSNKNSERSIDLNFVVYGDNVSDDFLIDDRFDLPLIFGNLVETDDGYVFEHGDDSNPDNERDWMIVFTISKSFKYSVAVLTNGVRWYYDQYDRPYPSQDLVCDMVVGAMS